MSSPDPRYRMTSQDDPGRRQSFDLARQSERLTLGMREFETLSRVVARDFRVPMRLVAATLRNLAEARREIDAASRRDIQAMRGALSQIEQMIFDLEELCLASSRPLALETVDMEGMVREIWAAMPRAQGIAISLGKLPAALGDRDMLRIVWRHLLANAVARCADRSAPRVDVTGGGSPAFAVYSVRDNGAHLALHSTGKLRHSFEQLQKQSAHPGVGVALAIVQSLVTIHRGHVWVEASADGGALFQFSVGEVPQEH